MKIQIQKDKPKAKSLFEMALVSLERLREINIEKYPSNSLTDYYDILHKLMEALCCLDGVKFIGEGAHLELIDYICKNISEGDRIFLQQLREYRNRIAYEGFFIEKSYINRNKKRMDYLIDIFIKKLEF